jgi:hypothetical protein
MKQTVAVGIIKSVAKKELDIATPHTRYGKKKLGNHSEDKKQTHTTRVVLHDNVKSSNSNRE